MLWFKSTVIWADTSNSFNPVGTSTDSLPIKVHPEHEMAPADTEKAALVKKDAEDKEDPEYPAVAIGALFRFCDGGDKVFDRSSEGS
eukprot:SAG11_NODE_9709_length_887_cov_1.668782_2_plen_87_part_00